MRTANVKEMLINRINRIRDMKLLEDIYALVKLEQELKDEEVYMLPMEKEKSLLKTYQDVKKGNFLTDEQANREADEWLEE